MNTESTYSMLLKVVCPDHFLRSGILMQILHSKITYLLMLYVHWGTPNIVTACRQSGMPTLGSYIAICTLYYNFTYIRRSKILYLQETVYFNKKKRKKECNGAFLLHIIPVFMRQLEQGASPAF